MKSECQVCGATFRGIPLNSVKDGKDVEVCPACYKTLDEIYRKNSCKACVFYNLNSCELFGTDLEDLCASRAKCTYFSTDSDPTAISMAKIKKYEMTKRYEDAAKEYEKLKLPERAAEERKKIKSQAPAKLSLEELVAQLTDRGQNLTYFCPHCGALLRIGAKNEVLESCPNCKYDLSVLDLAKLINQHL